MGGLGEAAFPLLGAGLVILFGFVVHDSVLFQKRGKRPLPQSVKIFHAASRWTLILAGIMISLSLPVCGVEYFGSEAFDLPNFIMRDMLGVINMLHGGFILGVFSNYSDTGNPRYITVPRFLIGFMALSPFVSAVLSARALAQNSGLAK